MTRLLPATTSSDERNRPSRHLQALYPGHRRTSTTPIEDIDTAIVNAQKLLERSTGTGPEIFYQKTEEL